MTTTERPASWKFPPITEWFRGEPKTTETIAAVTMEPREESS